MVAVAAASVIGAAPVAVFAQTNWKAEVNGQLNSPRLAERLAGLGYSRSHEAVYNMVTPGERRSIRFNMYAGRTYEVIGACDNDCSDLDLFVYDENGVLVTSDVENDDHPIVIFTVQRTAKYRVDVVMTRCATFSCGWGVVAWAKGGPTTTAANGAVGTLPPWKEQINSQLVGGRGIRLLLDRGYTRSHGIVYDVQAPSTTKGATYDLTAGRHYIFAAMCDNDCRDVDISLYDPAGKLVDSDTKTDDFPMVNVTPPRAGRYTLRVRIVNCSTRTCGWGALALVK